MRPFLLLFPLLAAAIPQVRQRSALDLSQECKQQPLLENGHKPKDGNPSKLQSMLDAVEVMQKRFWDTYSGTWGDAIDWTAAVVNTQILTTLSSIARSFPAVADTCPETLEWVNIVNKYFTHSTVFYFNENAFGLRQQAYDDMLWVVLEWLESIKFAFMYSSTHYEASTRVAPSANWHGMQFVRNASHRARIFYELASKGWDDRVCHGGMTWNPNLLVYKNAITNELYIAASIGMYLYWPGDNNSAPFMQEDSLATPLAPVHDPVHLQNAVKAYDWLISSNMTCKQGLTEGLYGDGFHVRGYRDPWHPGTGQCDQFDSMVYTYNQGVLLSGSRGLWLATGDGKYLEDGHTLIANVMRATGWPLPQTNEEAAAWSGLGSHGIMEEACDRRASCSQDGQTFKGVFFWHLSEFCHPLSMDEENIYRNLATHTHSDVTYQQHLDRCRTYKDWVEHNAAAAESTKDHKGRFGMWWNTPNDKATRDPAQLKALLDAVQLPLGAVDHKNLAAGERSSDALIVPHGGDVNDRGRGRTVETQAGGLAVMRARWNWEVFYGEYSEYGNADLETNVL